MKGRSTPLALPVARKVAESHAESGLVEFNLLQGVVDAAKKENSEPNFLQLIRHGVPAATNLTLALELMVKVLSYQHTGTYPYGHDLVKLVAQLPTDCLSRMRAAFLVRCAEKRELRVVHFRLDLNSDSTPLPEPGPEQNSTTLDEALASLARAYEHWRYIYENLAGSGASIDFRSLLYLIDIVQGEVASFKGNARATLSSEKSFVLLPNNSLQADRER